ncbi:MAG: 1-deoxy-D-xylulose-5-phosphate synthase [Coriobacteriales bacterium]|jgi:1-deoxy-D-xylulose-5-phosphate synthase
MDENLRNPDGGLVGKGFALDSSNENGFILSQIESPKDLRRLSYSELDQLATEIRATILSVVSQNGGHLASSLGAVELIIALNRVLSNDNDRIVYDVGHQALAHKLLTGRFNKFSTLRQYGGIAGFPRREESKYDVHDSGHASDSLSTGLGVLLAKELNGDKGEVAVLIGDASISGGMAFEALNHIGQLKRNLIIVLNDNEMSISKNVGAMALYLGKIRLSENYLKTRDKVESHFYSLGDIGRFAMDMGERAKDSVKRMLVGGTLFEDMGITYIGPIDGHSIPDVEEAILAAKEQPGPILIHAVTKKGKGYPPAEKSPSKFHSVPSFDIETGEIGKVSGSSGFTKVFSKLMRIEGRRNPNIVAITAAMEDGTGLKDFGLEFPRRFFDVGIAEEHAVTLASGLAIGGKIPIVAIYSTFLQRGFDQIVTNVALQNLHVVFCIDRAGIVGHDGSTHHGLFDIAYLRMIPNMTILAPSRTSEIAGAFKAAINEIEGPVAIRYPRRSRYKYEPTGDEEPWPYAKALEVRHGTDVAFLAVGRMVRLATDTADKLEELGISCQIYDMRWVKPVDRDAIKSACGTKLVVTIEDGTIKGGFADAVLEEMADFLSDLEGSHPKLLRLGIPDVFVQHGSEDELFDELGLNPDTIVKQVLDKLDFKGQ